MSNSRPSPANSSLRSADVIVIGDGVIGLACALAIARAGGTCRVLGRTIGGAASAASGGLLAPSIGGADPSFRAFMRASRDRYPAWVHWLAERTGIEIPLSRAGIIELGNDAVDSTATDAELLDSAALAALEPSIGWTGAARLHHEDGYVDNVRLLAALREAVRCEWSIDVVDGRLAAIQPGIDDCSVRTEDGRSQFAKKAIVAAGAWSALIVGAPRPIPVEPVRGQMVLIEGCPLSHAVSSPDAYLVPRGGSTLVGSTLERVGFDHSTTPPAIERLRIAAGQVVPKLANAPAADAWGGLRPMTPDGLPIIGHDPDLSSVIYACGHGKNGILLAPITGEVVAALAAGTSSPHDISEFAVERFD
jgi:glycine/D-amino acid oxidase-like deaminating enzyme